MKRLNYIKNYVDDEFLSVGSFKLNRSYKKNWMKNGFYYYSYYNSSLISVKWKKWVSKDNWNIYKLCEL